MNCRLAGQLMDAKSELAKAKADLKVETARYELVYDDGKSKGLI